MRKYAALGSLLILFLFASVNPPLGAQTQKPAAAPKVALSDEELDKLYSNVITDDWQISQPAVKKVATLDNASKAKLVPRFMKILGTEDHGYAAEQALGAIGAPALPELLKAAQNDTGQRQQYAVGAIGEIKPPAKTAIPVLLNLAKSADKDLIQWVISALGKIGPAGPGSATTPQTLDVLTKAFNEGVPGCEGAMGSYGAPAIPVLRKVLQTSDDPKLRSRAVSALSAMGAGAAPAVPELMTALKDPELRVSAISILAEIGAPAKPAVPLLKKVVMKDPDYWTAPKTPARGDEARDQAMKALVKIGVDTDFLVEVMKQGNLIADAALARLGAPVVPIMKNLLSSPSMQNRRSALQVLSMVGPKAEPVVPDMIQLMGEKDLAIWAIRVLAGVGPGAKPAVPGLINALRNESLRGEAMGALASIGPGAQEAVPFLIDVLQGKKEFSHDPPPPGFKYVYGEKMGEIGRIGMQVIDEDGSRTALLKIGTPEALAAVKEYDARKK